MLFKIRRLSSKRERLLFSLTLVAIIVGLQTSSFAHGVAGQRFFPTTFAVEDPFVSDEFSALYHSIKANDETGEPKATELEMAYSKHITPNFGIEVEESYQRLSADGGETASGFGNLEVSLKYQFYKNEGHETILSFGVADEIGHTGSSKVGAETFSVISPAFFFGKGFGNLPASVSFLRPLAVAGVIGPNFPSRNSIETFNEETGGNRKRAKPHDAHLGVDFPVQPDVSPECGKRRGAWRSLQPHGRSRRIPDGDLPERRL